MVVIISVGALPLTEVIQPSQNRMVRSWVYIFFELEKSAPEFNMENLLVSSFVLIVVIGIHTKTSTNIQIFLLNILQPSEG